MKYQDQGRKVGYFSALALTAISYRKQERKCCPILTSTVSGSPILQNGQLVGAVTHV